MADRIAVMNDGRIEQLGEPLALYDRPANLFVAQFIGSPPMNVVHGSLEGQRFKTAGATVEVPVKGSIAKAILGVRPEDCSVVAPGKGALRGTIYTTELIGDHTLVTIEAATDKLTVKAPKDFGGKQGDAIGVALSKDHLFVFDADSGQRVR